MIQAAFSIEKNTLQSFQKCKVFKTQIEQEIKAYQDKLKDISQVSKYTKEIKKEKLKLEEKLKDCTRILGQVEKMLELKPGNWVKNGTNIPGKVIELKIAGRVPEVHVLWENNTVAVPEIPHKLKIIEYSNLEYVWNGENYPRLIRKADHAECDNLAVLADNYHDCLESDQELFTEDRQRKIAYCLKRFNHLTKKLFPPGIRVEHNKYVGTAQDYSQSSESRELIKVPVILDSDENGNLFVQRYVSPLELINLGHQKHLFKEHDELEKLEVIIEQGLETFYKVGQAFIKIRDRKLYKELGYSRFEDYCKERWNMSRHYAYRLIKSSEVVENVANCQQNLPATESQTRELAKLPAQQQGEAWAKAVESSEDGKPTAKEVKEAVNEIKAPKQEIVSIVDNFQVGQLVQITNCDRSDKRLVGLKNSYAVITSVNPASVDIQIFNRNIANISPNDIKSLPKDYQPRICMSVSHEEMRQLFSMFNSPEEIITYAIAAKSLNL